MELNYQDAMDYIKGQMPIFLEKASEKTYVCPACHYGKEEGESGLYYGSAAKEFYCPACKKTSDIFQLLADLKKVKLYASSENYSKIFLEACSIYDVELIHEAPSEEPREQDSSRKMSEYILDCHENVSQTNYFRKRGISDEMIERFYLGYDENFVDEITGQSYRAVILPTSESTYEARNIDVEMNVTRNRHKFRKHGTAKIFNGQCLLDESEEPIFVCGGIFDALSIIQLGGQAIAILSSFSLSLLVKDIDMQVPKVPLILCLPNDLNELLSLELKKRKIAFLSYPEISSGYKDVNHRLVEDMSGLRANIESATKQAFALPDQIECAREEFSGFSAGSAVSGLLREIKSSASKTLPQTGFSGLDEALDGGLFPGLYVFGGASSLGKTTFLVQIADNLAKQGQDVLFFSLSQSKKDLISKSISRETYEYCEKHNIPLSYAKSGLGVADGRKWRSYSRDEISVLGSSINEYRTYANHLFIYDLTGSISVDDIREKLALYRSVTNNTSPIVIIDSLQGMFVSVKEKQIEDNFFVDKNVSALSRLARDFEIPILCISSWSHPIKKGVEDKETLSYLRRIEAATDVLITFHFSHVDERDFYLEEAKEKNPRELELSIIKTATGRPSRQASKSSMTLVSTILFAGKTLLSECDLFFEVLYQQHTCFFFRVPIQ